jgi:hypothetical protein
MDIDKIIKAILGLSPFAIILGLYVLLTTDLIFLFLPLILWIVVSLIARLFIDNSVGLAILGFLFTTYIMSIMSLLIYYFPNTIGTGLFADGYTLASVITISNGLDLLFYAQTISIGIVFDWIVLILGTITFVGFLFISNRISE